jgi:hypothetical protein
VHVLPSDIFTTIEFYFTIIEFCAFRVALLVILIAGLYHFVQKEVWRD